MSEIWSPQNQHNQKSMYYQEVASIVPLKHISGDALEEHKPNFSG